MNVFSVSRRIVRRVASQIDLLEQVRQEIVAATARLLQPTGVLVPIRVGVTRQERAGLRDQVGWKGSDARSGQLRRSTRED
jgi:GTP cyclohydrolase I